MNSPYSLTRTTKLFTSVAASLLLAGATLTVAAPAAGAADTGSAACPNPAWSNKSPGKGTPKGASALIRVGPSADCAVAYEVGTAVVMQYHCWVTNAAGNKWTHVRVDNTNYEGWVYNERLDDGGSVHPDNRC
ncbi:SH3 domain-containing protein [Streptomyces sp. NPDC014894]|uniref:SH3 domain-containing protein n=1 Tax=Streptomyces sp. NPDC014894 TaxID=3364931 RepID=UPI0036FD44AF